MSADWSDAKSYLPSPGEIRQACRQIRGEWSLREQAARRADARQVWRLLVDSRSPFAPRRLPVAPL
jgi:hypothetical protein